MKTFFNITIDGLGDRIEKRIQSTKLLKVRKNSVHAFYTPKEAIFTDSYRISIQLAMTYNIEMGGTVIKPIKQKRFNLHRFEYELYEIDKFGMYHNAPSELINVGVNTEEVDVVPCEYIVSQNNI